MATLAKIQALRGMKDVLPDESAIWLTLEKIINQLFSSYGYKNIRTPIVEKTTTFSKAIGSTTDIVEKEMYSWDDLNGESISLRPEGTAGCVRAVIEHNLMRQGTQKVFYQGTMFRHERPQQGRYRQFNQVGAEVFGVSSAKIDAELIAMSHQLWQKLGLKDISLEINTLGTAATKTKYKNILINYFTKHKHKLDEHSLKRINTNPLRILDSKDKNTHLIVKQAPKLSTCIDYESKKHFDEFINYLDCLNVNYKINEYLVRGLDYYNSTVFEWISHDLGTQNAICAGGRYDNLIAKMGGKATPAIGFALGMERLILLLKKQKINLVKPQTSVYLIASNIKTQLKSMQVAESLHNAIPKLILYNGTSISSLQNQLKKADKIKADYALILAENELNNNTISIKPLRTDKAQQEMSLSELINHLKEKV